MEITCSWSCWSENWNINRCTWCYEVNSRFWLYQMFSDEKQKLNLFENVVEAGSAVVVRLSPLPWFPADSHVFKAVPIISTDAVLVQVNEFLMLMHKDPINHTLQVPIWRTLFQEEFRFKWLHARVQASVMQLCSLNMLCLPAGTLPGGFDTWVKEFSNFFLQLFHSIQYIVT